jgi:phosphomevalonate kinase
MMMRGEKNADVKDKRHYIRLMSKASAVPVEPQEQTNLLEESILAPGVIGGTVPGGKSLL